MKLWLCLPPCGLSALLFLPPLLSPLYLSQFLITASQSLTVMLCTADAPEQVTAFLNSWQCSTAVQSSLDAHSQDMSAMY